MRAASRLLASVKTGQFLEAGTPTGLTGLNVHPSPRSTLVYLYSSTLDKLQQIPPASVYRQSTEALTKHRLQIVEAVKPAGFDAWQQKVQMVIGDNPEAFKTVQTSRGLKILVASNTVDSRTRQAEWDGETMTRSFPEGIRNERERKPYHKQFVGPEEYTPELDFKEVTLDPEPQLTAEQISDIESQIGAGLIEEVIQIAEGEEKLVGDMVKSKVWEELEEKAPKDQWGYFERSGHHTSTQKP